MRGRYGKQILRVMGSRWKCRVIKFFRLNMAEALKTILIEEKKGLKKKTGKKSKPKAKKFTINITN